MGRREVGAEAIDVGAGTGLHEGRFGPDRSLAEDLKHAAAIGVFPFESISFSSTMCANRLAMSTHVVACADPPSLTLGMRTAGSAPLDVPASQMPSRPASLNSPALDRTPSNYLVTYFFGFMIYQTICGESDQGNWLVKLTEIHYATLAGTPMSAVAAFCIVSILKVTHGPIEFEAFGF